MTNFFDLPKEARERIYRLALVRDAHISYDDHLEITEFKRNYVTRNRAMVPLLSISKKAEKEAAHIYYGENHFEFARVWHVDMFLSITFPRLQKLVRKLTVTWAGSGLDREGFLAIVRMKGLQELYIRVDEQPMVEQHITPRYIMPYWVEKTKPTPQQQLRILRFPGATGLLSLSGIPRAQFIQRIGWAKELYGGPLPGGFLETEVVHRLTAEKLGKGKLASQTRTFDLLSLPPEVRNRIYELLLCIAGPLHPSTKEPSSAPTKSANRKATPLTAKTALCLLGVNKQIHEEALGLFYHKNSFVFYYPTQLQAFLISLSPQRQRCLHDITIYYYNVKIGGINLVDLTFPMLKHLPSLGKLHIIMHNELRSRIHRVGYTAISPFGIDSANPGRLPGVGTLFTLRGIADIRIRDLELEKSFQDIKNSSNFPKFAKGSRDACIVKLTAALEHFNAALADAQQGRVNDLLLEDNKWQTWDVFPKLKAHRAVSEEL